MPPMIKPGKGQLQRTARSWIKSQSSVSSYHTPSRLAVCPQCQFSSQRQSRRQPRPKSKFDRSIHSSGTRYAISQDDSAAQSNKIPETHYDFFPKSLSAGPPPKGPFVIDLKALRNEFIQLQAKAHPDRHPQEMKRRAEATSARINEAYKTLQNPLKRAQYLLSLRGIDVAEDETAKVEDPDLLMEVLETREEIEAAQEEGDLIEMKEINDERIRKSEEIIDKAFKDDDMVMAKEEAVRLRYWVNIQESLHGWEKGKPVVLNH